MFNVARKGLLYKLDGAPVGNPVSAVNYLDVQNVRESVRHSFASQRCTPLFSSPPILTFPLGGGKG